MQRTRSAFCALLIVAAVATPATARSQQDDARWLDDCRSSAEGYRRLQSFCEIRETRVRAPGGTITMEGLRNGGLSVTGWDKDSMVIRTRLRTSARTQADARSIASEVHTVVRGSDVSVEGPRNEDDAQWSASLYAMVPRKTDLRLGTRNGPVSIDQVQGDIDAQTSNGPMSLRDLGGSVHARTTNGPLSISLSGTQWTGSGLEARTTNGPLTITVPDGYNARLEAGTTNGPVNLGFPITVVGRITRDIATNLGSGGATIRATTTNGPLSIRRK